MPKTNLMSSLYYKWMLKLCFNQQQMHDKCTLSLNWAISHWILLVAFEWCPCQNVSLSGKFAAIPFHALFSLCIIQCYWFLESGFYFAINSFQQLDLSLPFHWCLFFKSWLFPFSNLHIYICTVQSLCFVVVLRYLFSQGPNLWLQSFCNFFFFRYEGMWDRYVTITVMINIWTDKEWQQLWKTHRWHHNPPYHWTKVDFIIFRYILI